MHIKVPVDFIDMKRLKKVIDDRLIQAVDAQLPHGSNDDRSALYDTMYDKAEALLDLLTERGYVVFDFNFETKKVRLVK